MLRCWLKVRLCFAVDMLVLLVASVAGGIGGCGFGLGCRFVPLCNAIAERIRVSLSCASGWQIRPCQYPAGGRR